MDFLVIGRGMFGAAIARYLAPHARVTVAGPEAPADGSQAYGAHHDEGRITGDVGRDLVWSELNRRARAGMAGLDPALITPCGALIMTAGGGPGYLSVAARIRERDGSGIRTLTPAQARTGFPMLRSGAGETILHQPDAGHFSARRYVALATRAARDQGAVIVPGTVHALRSSGRGVEAELGGGR